uniref:Globin family profile domain-containing protein n=1 Tax=Caenorhabditis japonica TaxID=281687 RepID=A0A8R1E0D8_CAEJA
MNAVELRRHASVYLKGLGKIIESMRNEEELGKSMSRIAQAHIKWNVQRNHVIVSMGKTEIRQRATNSYALKS